MNWNNILFMICDLVKCFICCLEIRSNYESRLAINEWMNLWAHWGRRDDKQPPVLSFIKPSMASTFTVIDSILSSMRWRYGKALHSEYLIRVLVHFLSIYQHHDLLLVTPSLFMHPSIKRNNKPLPLSKSCSSMKDIKQKMGI